jgi:hypothetical protein
MVLAKMTKNSRGLLEGADLSVPEAAIKQKRAEIRQAEDSEVFITGQIAELQKNEREKAAQIKEFHNNAKQIGKVIDSLKQKQFSGVNTDDLNTEKCMLEDKINNDKSGENEQALKEIESALFEAENREYHSKFAQPIQEKDTLLKTLSMNYHDLKKRLAEINIGEKCPTCLMEITEQNIDNIKQGLQARIMAVFEDGKAERAKFDELKELDRQAREKFDEFREADIAKVRENIAIFKKSHPDNKSEVFRRINEINAILKYGSLTDGEYSELTNAEAALQKMVSELKALQATDYAKRIGELTAKQEQVHSSKTKANEVIKALQDYTAKRSEIALSGLKTSNVEIQLYEIVKTTGELKPCFKFLYQGREYPTLSLSEKIKAGFEITAMLRGFLDLDYPVFIDNSESIGKYDGIDLPEQTFIMKFIKDAPLKVVFKNKKPEDGVHSAQQTAA